MHSLDPRLGNDSLFVAALGLSDLWLMNDRRFPWLLLVPRRDDVSEIFDLSPADRIILGDETATIAAALKAATGADKINIGALGNIVRQLHVHIVARFAGDAAWPGPVWGAGMREPYDDPESAVARWAALAPFSLF